ncbi:unnamed protein product [Somion occarium]
MIRKQIGPCDHSSERRTCSHLKDLPLIPPNVGQLTGPLLLGHLFNWGLFGALAVQTYIYYIAFPNDRLLPKSIVGFTFITELLQTLLATRDAFRDFGTGWGNMEELDSVGLLWLSVPVLGSIMCFTTQAFFAWRVWILSKNKRIVGIIMVLALTSFVVGLYSGAFTVIIGKFSEVQKRAYRTTCVWLGGTALCDMIIAGSMIFYLHRTRTGFHMSPTILSKFIRLTIETGLTCATIAIVDLALFLGFQQNNYHLAPSIALSKLYANSLLVVLMTTEHEALAYFNRVSSFHGKTGTSAIAISISHTREADVDDVSRGKRIPMTDMNDGSHRANQNDVLHFTSASSA